MNRVVRLRACMSALPLAHHFAVAIVVATLTTACARERPPVTTDSNNQDNQPVERQALVNEGDDLEPTSRRQWIDALGLSGAVGHFDATLSLEDRQDLACLVATPNANVTTYQPSAMVAVSNYFIFAGAGSLERAVRHAEAMLLDGRLTSISEMELRQKVYLLLGVLCEKCRSLAQYKVYFNWTLTDGIVRSADGSFPFLVVEDVPFLLDSCVAMGPRPRASEFIGQVSSELSFRSTMLRPVGTVGDIALQLDRMLDPDDYFDTDSSGERKLARVNHWKRAVLKQAETLRPADANGVGAQWSAAMQHFLR